MPVAFLMGVEWKDCGLVAELLGVKIFVNEFVGYEKLGVLMQNRQDCMEPSISVSRRLNKFEIYFEVVITKIIVLLLSLLRIQLVHIFQI